MSAVAPAPGSRPAPGLLRPGAGAPPWRPWLRRPAAAAAVAWWAGPEAWLFGAAFALNLGLALLLALGWHMGNLDAVSRTAQASHVLFSRDPHVAAVGFVWPPLPALLQVPLVPLIRVFGHPELAGSIVSATAGALLVVVLYRALGLLGVTGPFRLLWLGTMQLHPLYGYLAASGMAEVALALLLTFAALAFLRLPGGVAPAIYLGTSLAAAFLTRYEALAFMVAIVVACVLQRWPPWTNWQVALEGRLLAVLSAPAYAVLLWLFVNWTIMGDPLYFQHSVFSLAAAPDVARNAGPAHALYPAMGSLPLTLAYALQRLAQVDVAALVLLPLALWWMVRTRDRRLLGLLLLVASLFVFTASQVYLGSLATWMRYWVYVVPFAVLLAGYVCGPRRGRLGQAYRVGATLLLGASVVVCSLALADPTASVDEQRLAARLAGDGARDQALARVDSYAATLHDAALLAPALDEVSARGLTLVDTETAMAAILRARYPQLLAISSDRDFHQVLENPRQSLRYIAVTDPSVGKARDLVNQAYPSLFEGRLAWARLYREVEGTIQPWRIYEVVPPRSERPEGTAP